MTYLRARGGAHEHVCDEGGGCDGSLRAVRVVDPADQGPVHVEPETRFLRRQLTAMPSTITYSTTCIAFDLGLCKEVAKRKKYTKKLKTH